MNVHLPLVYKEIFLKSNKALLAYASRESISNLEQNAIFDDIQLLESVWDKKESVFLGYLHKKIVHMVHRETGFLSGINGATQYQLALVDQNEFEDWLCVTDLAIKIQGEHRYSMHVLTQQLASRNMICWVSALTPNGCRISWMAPPNTLGATGISMGSSGWVESEASCWVRTCIEYRCSP